MWMNDYIINHHRWSVYEIEWLSFSPDFNDLKFYFLRSTFLSLYQQQKSKLKKKTKTNIYEKKNVLIYSEL